MPEPPVPWVAPRKGSPTWSTRVPHFGWDTALPGLDQLGRLVVFRSHVVDGVTRTVICTVLHR